MKILVDAMGGDNAPLCVLQGVSQAAAEFGDGMELVLLGEEAAIKDCAAQNKIDLAPFEIINCTENIDMHDDPVKSVRRCWAQPSRSSRHMAPATPRASKMLSARPNSALPTTCAAPCRRPWPLWPKKPRLPKPRKNKRYRTVLRKA